MDNQWDGRKHLPGGGLKIWETFAEGLAREVWEETGLEVVVGEMIYADDEFFLTPHGSQWHTVKLFYLAKATGGALRDTIIEGEPTVRPHWIDPHVLGPDDLTLGWKAVQKALAYR